jgi:hypothetical protein
MDRTSPAGGASSRRDYLKASSAALVAGAAGAISMNVHAASSDTLRVGLIGCGGRGTGAASQALAADQNVKLVAMADAFPDRLEKSLKTLKKDQAIAEKIDVDKDHCFVGFNAYKELIASGVDVVLLCTPPHCSAASFESSRGGGQGRLRGKASRRGRSRRPLRFGDLRRSQE